MLVSITTQCQMSCSHCMEDAQKSGEFMTMATFQNCISFIRKIYGNVKLISISGGEPTEHPLLFDFFDYLDKDWIIILTSNGLFLNNNELKNRILAYRNVTVQIYNDPLYYPIRVNDPLHPRILYSNKINLLAPFGRALKNGMKSKKQYPSCYNLRSLVRGLNNDLSKAIKHLRVNQKFCSPAIKWNGDIVAGESSMCYKIGTVESPNDEIVNNILSMTCNRCGLEKNLTSSLKANIGMGV